MNIEQKDNPRNDLIPYSRLVETFKVDPTSPSGLRYTGPGRNRRADLMAGAKVRRCYQVSIDGRLVGAHRVIEALGACTDIDLSTTRTTHMSLSERFKVDPTSPSGLTWLVHGPGVRAGDHAGSMTPQGYYTISKGRHALWAHHVVFELTHGRPCRPGFEIDHKDRDPGNNHPDNLREVTKGQNGFNKLGSNTAWFPKGINMNKRTGQVQAIIYKDGVQYRPGRSFMDHLDQSSEKLNALIEETFEALQELHGEHGCYDSYYCQLPIEAVLGPDEGWP